MSRNKAKAIVKEVLSHLPDNLRSYVMTCFPYSKIHLRIDEGLSDNDIKLYTADLFNRCYIHDGTLDLCHAINLRKLKSTTNIPT